MTGFWDLGDGTSATDSATTEYEKPGGNFELFPEGSWLVVVADDVKWDKPRDGLEKFVSIRWSVLEPEEAANRKIFQKLWVDDLDPNKVTKDKQKAIESSRRDKTMLASIDKNLGGKLSKKETRPTDEDLGIALCGSPIGIRLGVWEIEDRSTGRTNSGNWVQAVRPASQGAALGKATPVTKAKPASTRDDTDSIPF